MPVKRVKTTWYRPGGRGVYYKYSLYWLQLVRPKGDARSLFSRCSVGFKRLWVCAYREREQ